MALPYNILRKAGSKMKHTVEQRAKNRWVYTFEGKNSIGESLIVEAIRFIPDLKETSSVMMYWVKSGKIRKALSSYWTISTYVHDSEGHCYGKYNPMLKAGGFSENGQDCQHYIMDYAWVLEGTEENLQKLLGEAYRRFSEATGKSATEIKMEKIYAYAKQHGIKVYESEKDIPEGLTKSNLGCNMPVGTVLLTNKKSPLKGESKEALLVV